MRRYIEEQLIYFEGFPPSPEAPQYEHGLERLSLALQAWLDALDTWAPPLTLEDLVERLLLCERDLQEAAAVLVAASQALKATQ